MHSCDSSTLAGFLAFRAGYSSCPRAVHNERLPAPYGMGPKVGPRGQPPRVGVTGILQAGRQVVAGASRSAVLMAAGRSRQRCTHDLIAGSSGVMAGNHMNGLLHSRSAAE